ncbi:MAG TPA: acylneuraminate cytidylyltransferase family protein [Tepidisphaeraceae bacterium]|jgi:CMP-N-acetylneuraminic acid synthetase|nr:acylneuraminate cytidylyltransferase family protein [Tepidisphaeraceae bacterium]
MKPSIAAIVPMRHDSKRVPGKNYRLFAGRPLYHQIILQLQQCPAITQILIDTDSPMVRDDARKNFPRVKVVERPEHLRADTTPMNDVLLHSTRQVEADFYLQTHSTNPLLSAATISRGIDTFFENHPAFDTLFSVTRVQSRLWDGLARPINHNAAILLRTQDLPPVYEENSCLYLFTRSTLETRHNRIGDRPMLFPIEKSEAVDIDEEIDFRIAELMYLQQNGAARECA